MQKGPASEENRSRARAGLSSLQTIGDAILDVTLNAKITKGLVEKCILISTPKRSVQRLEERERCKISGQAEKKDEQIFE